MVKNNQGEMFRRRVVTKVMNMMIVKVIPNVKGPIDLTTQTTQSSNVSDLSISPQERAQIPTVARNIFAVDTIQPNPKTQNYQI